MKKFLTLILLSSLVFTACNSKWNNPDPNMPEDVRLEFEAELEAYYDELKEDPTDAHAMLGVANKSRLLGDYRTAAKYYEMILDENPYDTVVLNNYIVMLEEVDEYVEASGYVKTLFELTPTDIGVLEDVVRIHLEIGEPDNAQAALEYYVTLTAETGLSDNANQRVSDLFESIYQYNLENED